MNREDLAPTPQLLELMAQKRAPDADRVARYASGMLTTAPAGRIAGPARARPNRLRSRQRQRSPDRLASRNRRRTLGGSSALPDTLRASYTEGQRAVLCIIAGEVKRHGMCDLPIDKIAALAGVCRTTVQTTLHEARLLGHIAVQERPRRGERSLTNVIRIMSAEWRAWLLRAGKAALRWGGSNSLKMVSATKREQQEKGVDGIAGASPQGRAPPDTGHAGRRSA